MKLQSPPFDADAELIVDWMELSCIVSGDSHINFSELSRTWDANKVSEDLNPMGDEADFEEWMIPVYEVIQRRAESLQQSYPFDLVRGDSALRFKGAEGVGAHAYLLCLYLATVNVSEVFDTPAQPHVRARDLFQAVSGWAAAGAVGGICYSIGWPRPEKNNYRAALELVFNTMMNDGDALAMSRLPQGASGYEKDGGIDVIAWRPRPDRAAGKIVMVGQVASGDNWVGKAVKAHLSRMCKTWLSKPLAVDPIPVMFIPFSIPREKGATYQDQVHYESVMYGAIFHREVLPRYAEEGVQSNAPATPIH